MARVIYSNLVNEIRGSVGGLTFHKNTSGSIVKLKPVSKRSGINSVNLNNIAFSALANEWAQLTQGERDQWTVYATAHIWYNRYNVVVALNGYNVFMSVNSLRHLCALPTLVIPDVYSMPAVPDNPVLNNNIASLSVDFDSTPASLDYWFICFLSPPNRLSYSKQRTQLRFAMAFQPQGVNYFDITTAFEAMYGLIWPFTGVDNSYRITSAFTAVHGPSGTQSIFQFSTSQFST
jgi:hypothetical protein